MEASRTAKSIRNAKVGMLLQAAAILTSFVTRTAFVRVLGISFNGLNGLFNEVIAMMSLAELGVGTAIVYNLYRPLAERDVEAVRRLMGLFKRAYRIIAAAIVVIGLALTPFIQFIVKGTEFKTDYIRVVFLLFVLQTASSYLFAYKRSLLNADQQNYVVSLVMLAASVIMTGVNVAVLVLFRNYILYLVVQMIGSVGTNLVISWAADRRYPYIRHNHARALPEEKRDVMKNIRHIFIGDVSGRITTSTDNILISVLVSTYQIGIYANYAMIMNAVMTLFRKGTEAIAGGIGNLMVTETPRRVDMVFRRAGFLLSSIGFVVAVILYSVLTPFIQLWIGGDYIISAPVLYISVFNVFLFIAREPLWKTMVAAGLFSRDKNISIIGSTANLIVSIFLGKLWGMAGIFLGTTISLVLQIILKTVLLYRERLDASPCRSLLAWLGMGVLTILCMAAAGLLCGLIRTPLLILDIAARGLAAAALGAGCIWVLFRKTEEFSYCMGLAKQIIWKKEVGSDGKAKGE